MVSQLLKGTLTVSGPVEGPRTLCRPVESFGYLCKVTNETPIVTGKSKELLHFSGGQGYGPSCHFLDLGGVCSNIFLSIYMAKVLDFWLEKSTLQGLQPQSSISEALKHCLQVL